MPRASTRLFLSLAVVSIAFLLGGLASEISYSNPPPTPNTSNWWNRFKGAFSFGQQTECVFRTKDHVYDFTKLHKTAGHYTGQDGAYKYEMNVCGLATSNPMCSIHYSSICQYSTYNNRYISSLGSWTGNPKPQWSHMNENDPSAGVQLTYRNGERCNVGAIQMPRVTHVQFVCADTDSQVFTVRSNAPTCTTTIRLPTTVACGAGGAGGFGSALKRYTFYLILLTFFYVAAGCFYNVEYNGKQWGQVDAIPNYEFWLTVPGHVKTGVDWTVEKAKTLMNRDTQGYEQFKPGQENSAPDSTKDDDDDDGLSGL